MIIIIVIMIIDCVVRFAHDVQHQNYHSARWTSVWTMASQYTGCMNITDYISTHVIHWGEEGGGGYKLQ